MLKDICNEGKLLQVVLELVCRQMQKLRSSGFRQPQETSQLLPWHHERSFRQAARNPAAQTQVSLKQKPKAPGTLRTLFLDHDWPLASQFCKYGDDHRVCLASDSFHVSSLYMILQQAHQSEAANLLSSGPQM